jgi:hypothetical protein
MVALYSVIHLDDHDLGLACAEFARVLRPGGAALISFHGGSEVRHLDDWWGTAVSLDAYFRSAAQVTEVLESAGLHVEARLERGPYRAVEGPTPRVYLLARTTTSDETTHGPGDA